METKKLALLAVLGLPTLGWAQTSVVLDQAEQFSQAAVQAGKLEDARDLASRLDGIAGSIPAVMAVGYAKSSTDISSLSNAGEAKGVLSSAQTVVPRRAAEDGKEPGAFKTFGQALASPFTTAFSMAKRGLKWLVDYVKEVSNDMSRGNEDAIEAVAMLPACAIAFPVLIAAFVVVPVGGFIAGMGYGAVDGVKKATDGFKKLFKGEF